MECQRGDRDDRYSENVVVCGRQCRNEEILGIEKILKHGRAIPGRILAAMFLTVCVICCRAQEVFAVNGDADTFPYRCSPVSEDLSALPAMENRVYAGWEGNIYYRQYSDEDTDEGGLWAEFEPVPGTAKEIMCMKPNGSVTQVGTDYGHGDFFIVGGRIYSQKYVQTREDGRQVTHEVVYSCELDGSGVKEYSASRVLAVKGCKVICGTGGYAGYDGHGITWIDGWDGEEHVLIPGKGLCHEAEYLGATEEEVFFYRLVENGSRMRVPYDVTLYSVDYQGKVGELATVTEQEYVDCLTDDLMEYPLYISCFRILGDDLYFSVGSANGNAYMYSGGMIYRVKRTAVVLYGSWMRLPRRTFTCMTTGKTVRCFAGCLMGGRICLRMTCSRSFCGEKPLMISRCGTPIRPGLTYRRRLCAAGGKGKQKAEHSDACGRTS